MAFILPVTLVGEGFDVLDPQQNVLQPESVTDDDTEFRLRVHRDRSRGGDRWWRGGAGEVAVRPDRMTGALVGSTPLDDFLAGAGSSTETGELLRRIGGQPHHRSA